MTVTSACSGAYSRLLGQRPRGGRVALADVGGEDQNAARRRALGARWVCGGGVA